MTVLYILMSVFLDSRQEKKIFSPVAGIMYRARTTQLFVICIQHVLAQPSHYNRLQS